MGPSGTSFEIQIEVPRSGRCLQGGTTKTHGTATREVRFYRRHHGGACTRYPKFRIICSKEENSKMSLVHWARRALLWCDIWHKNFTCNRTCKISQRRAAFVTTAKSTCLRGMPITGARNVGRFCARIAHHSCRPWRTHSKPLAISSRRSSLRT